MSSSPTLKIKLQDNINHLLLINWCVLGAVLIFVGKTERTKFERNFEHVYNDKDSVVKIHLIAMVSDIANIAKLIPSLFPDSIVDNKQDPRRSHINLIQTNTRTINHKS